MDPSFVATELDRRGYLGAAAELRDRPARPDPGLLDAGRRLADAFEHDLVGSELYCDVLIDALVTRVITRHVSLNEGRLPYAETLTSAKLKRLMMFVDHNLAAPLRLADLAAAAALSQAHLARAFRNAMGVPLHRYVLNRRLERARCLLEREGASVRAAASRCGFADPAHLSKAFQRAFGLPPSMVRPVQARSGAGNPTMSPRSLQSRAAPAVAARACEPTSSQKPACRFSLDRDTIAAPISSGMNAETRLPTPFTRP